MDWWVRHAPRFGLDRERTALMGLSAGATLALLASEHEAADPVAALVSVFGVYDLHAMGGPLGRLMPPLLLRGRSAAAEGVSPIERCRRDLPLTLLHGTGDTVVPVAQAHAFREVREAAGLPVELHLYDGAPHGFFNDPGAPVADAAREAVLTALRRDLGAR